MSFLEIATVLLLATLVAGCLLVNATGKDAAIEAWNPTTAVALFFGFYTVVGPLTAIGLDETVYAGRDFRPLFEIAWLASLLAFVVILLSFNWTLSRAQKVRARSVPQLFRNTAHVRQISIALFLIGIAGGLVWLFGSSASISLPLIGITIGDSSALRDYDSSRVNYFYHAINSMVPAVLLLFLTNHRRSPDHAMIFVLVAIFFMATFLVYSGVGFRYRVMILFLSTYIAYHVKYARRPQIAPLIVLLALMFVVMSVIAISRSYYEGLDFSTIVGATWQDFVLGGTRDTNIFFSLGAILDAVPERIDYGYFEPIWYVFVLPIPRIFWPGKPYPEYLGSISQAIGTFEAETAGSAIPNFGEFYVAFGWIGLVIGCAIFGWILAKVWIYARPRILTDPLIAASYALAFPFVIYALSRGYLAQIFQDFCFFFLPLWVASRLLQSSNVSAATKIIGKPFVGRRVDANTR